jgi:DNA-binding NtrC family response regulator
MSTILLVDDDPSVRKIVGDMLERSGHRVVAAADGAIALTTLHARNDVKLVIADHRMPGMDGLTLTRRIKELKPDLPVVIMTGYGDLESYLCATGLGVVRYITKPVGLRELRQAVLDAVEGGVCEGMFKQAQVRIS